MTEDAPSSGPEPDWRELATLDELERRGALVVKPEPRRQLAIVHAQGRCFALDNRCPHEGYPLSQGTVDGCVLTCNWHNWKFDLASGKNLVSGDHVRTYPVELREGKVFVDLRDPPREVLEAEAMAGLREAFDDEDHGWIARQLARLIDVGVDPLARAIPAVIGWAAPRLEWGTTHAFAAAADWLALHDRLAPEDLESRLVCLTELVEHFAHDALRYPEFAFPAPLAERFDHADFLAAVEAEQAERAIGLMRAAVAEGRTHAQLERSLSHAALRHYAGFGHALIYVVKAGELLARLGPAVADPTLSALARYLVYTRREELIPEFRPYAAALAEYPASADDPDDQPIPDAEVDALFGAGLRACFAWVHARARTHTAEQLWDALVRANARAMLHFDTRRAEASAVKVADNVGWLDFTHALTFASAVRRQCARFPDLWPAGLLQLACFVARNRAYLDRAVEVEGWRVDDEPAFWAAVDSRLLDHGAPLPIYSAHLLKTSAAVALEREHVSGFTRPVLLAALNRFLHSPIKAKHARRNVHQALALIGLGSATSRSA